MAKLLFLNVPLRDRIYLSTNVKVAAPHYPSLTLATLAGQIPREHDVKVFDCELDNNPVKLKQLKQGYSPDLVAFSINTPSAKTAYTLAKDIKETFQKAIIVVGGVHATTLPEEVRHTGCFDYLILGKGDFLLNEILSGDIKSSHIVDLKAGQELPSMSNDVLYENMIDLNTLPFPKWDYFKISAYSNSRISSRGNPVGLIETSRGCAFRCNFCNKKTFGTKFRVKSPDYVVEEFNYLYALGFKEIHIVDDSFTQDLERAKIICEN